MENREEKQNNMEIYYNSVLLNLEQAAKTNRFASKEEFNKYIEGMKKNGMPESILSEEKKKELLDTYDEFHKVDEAGLNMQDYKGINLNEQNYITNTQTDTILKTNGSKDELPQEFKSVQNEISAANNSDNLANADDVYNHMKNNTKEEVQMISLYEIGSRSNISIEVLQKIKFFISNKYINPYAFNIDPETGLLYNKETNEMLEVVKNPETGKFEIKKGGEVVYKEDSQIQEMNSESYSNDNQEKEKDTDEEEMINKKENHKVRRLLPPKDIPGQAAFAKTSFLIITSIFIALLISTIILIKK